MGDMADLAVDESIDFGFQHADDYYRMGAAEFDECYGGSTPPPDPMFEVPTTAEGLDATIERDDFYFSPTAPNNCDVQRIRLGGEHAFNDRRFSEHEFLYGDYGGLHPNDIERFLLRMTTKDLTPGELVKLRHSAQKYTRKWEMMVGMMKTVFEGHQLSEKQQRWLSTNITEPVSMFPKMVANRRYRNQIVAMRDFCHRYANPQPRSIT